MASDHSEPSSLQPCYDKTREQPLRSRAWNTLPLEIHDLIMSFCKSGRDAAAVAPTCYASLQSARRRLYRELTYDKKSSQSSFKLSWTATEIRSLVRLADTLVRRHELARLVQKAHIGKCWLDADADASEVESAAMTIIRLLSREKSLKTMEVDAWDGFGIHEPGIAVTSLSLSLEKCPEWWDAGPRVIDSWMRSALAMNSLRKLRFSTRYESGKLEHSRHLTWQTDDRQLVENPGKRPLSPKSSNIEEMFFGYGTVPTPHLFRHYLNKVRALRYLYIDFCICSRAIWGIDSLANLTDCLEHHVDSIETICVDISWGSALTYNPCQLRTFTKLRFIRTALDFVFPWKLVSNRHAIPQITEFWDPALVLPPSVETVVFSICYSFIFSRQEPCFIRRGRRRVSNQEEPDDVHRDIVSTSLQGAEGSTLTSVTSQVLLQDSEMSSEAGTAISAAAMAASENGVTTQDSENLLGRSDTVSGTEGVEPEESEVMEDGAPLFYDETDDKTYKVIPTPEARALLAWLADFRSRKVEGYFPHLHTIVIQSKEITPWLEWAALPEVVRLRDTLAEVDIDLLLE